MVENITESCVCLHNWLIGSSDEHYITEALVDHEEYNVLVPGSWRNDDNNFISLERKKKNPTLEAKKYRDRFAQYFCGSGRVEWQDKIFEK